jgi:hypothetical protein
MSFDNVFLIDKGQRLIDVGISVLKAQVGEKHFAKFVENEINESKDLKFIF